MKIFNFTQNRYNSNNEKYPVSPHSYSRGELWNVNQHAEMSGVSLYSSTNRGTLPKIKKLSQNLRFSQLSFGRVANAVKQIQSDKLCFQPNISYKISFGALKKTNFEGIDHAVVEKFKAPIEKFNSNNDLQCWAKERVNEIVNKEYEGRKENTKAQRNTILKEWSDCILKDNDTYKDTTALLIFNAITKNLKDNNDKLPPELNEDVLKDCINEIDKNTKADPKYQCDFNKMYEMKLRRFYFKDSETADNTPGWLIIQSKNNDSKHFEENVEKLKSLSYRNWCTRVRAKDYLEDGDFHVYCENGCPELGMRFIENKIMEIQGKLNDGNIPISYLDEVKNHILGANFKLAPFVYEEIEAAQKAQEELRKIKTNLKTEIENNDLKAVLEYFGIKVKEDKDGFWTISEYKPPGKLLSYKDIGIDENMIFKKVKRIDGNADFEYSNLTRLHNLEHIGGFANFENSQVQDLENLKYIGNHAYFNGSKVLNLGKLEKILGNVNFSYSHITNLANLKVIGGSVEFSYSHITNMGDLEEILGDANFQDSMVADLGNLEVIGGEACFSYSEIQDYGKLKSVNGKPFVSRKNVFNKLKNITSLIKRAVNYLANNGNE